MSETAQQNIRNQRKERTGEVISNKMQKTIVVSVKRRFPHAQFKKVVTSFHKFYAHDEKGEAKVGEIVETRPLSKTKRWRLVEVVERAVEQAQVAA